MSEDTEIWKDVEGYENKYQISNLGNVKSLNYNHTKTEKILKPNIDGSGYYFVDLHKDGKRKHYRIHRLISIHFIPNPNNFDYVDHINRDKKDNRIENLRWCTISTNTQNKTKSKKKHQDIMEYHGINKNENGMYK